MALKGPPGPMGFTGRPGPLVCYLSFGPLFVHIKSLLLLLLTSQFHNLADLKHSTKQFDLYKDFDLIISLR